MGRRDVPETATETFLNGYSARLPIGNHFARHGEGLQLIQS